MLVHGNPTWSFYYRRLIEKLSQNHRVVAVDNIGCGYSDKPQNYEYSLENHISNLSTLLETVGINQCSMVLHDWGGAIGMGYAVKNLAQIEKIVVMNTAAFRSKEIPLRIALCRLPLIGEIMVRGFNAFALAATYMAVTRPMAQNIRNAYLAPYNSWKNRIATHRFVQDIPLKPSHRSYSHLVQIEEGLISLHEQKIPLLILWGGKDFCFTKTFYDEWRERFPNAEAHFFADYGHYLLEDGFEEVSEHIELFFRDLV